MTVTNKFRSMRPVVMNSPTAQSATDGCCKTTDSMSAGATEMPLTLIISCLQTVNK